MSKMNSQMAQMQQELEAITEMFNRMSDQCFRKCITRYDDSGLSKGELSCIERCIPKYMEFHNLVGQRLSEFMEVQQKQLQQQQQQQQQ